MIGNILFASKINVVKSYDVSFNSCLYCLTTVECHSHHTQNSCILLILSHRGIDSFCRFPMLRL